MPRKFTHEEAVAIMRSAGVEPLEPYDHANAGWRCQCLRCGREVTPRLSSARYGRDGCIYCAGNKWADDDAVALISESGFDPLEKFPGKKLDWWNVKCLACGRPTQVTLASVLNGQRRCSKCTNRSIDWDKADAALAEQKLKPLEPYPGNNKVKWKCECLSCGAIVYPKLNNVLTGWGGCKPCGNKKTSAAMLLEAEACTALMVEHGLEPQEPYPGSNARWKCICSVCGRNVQPSHSNVKSGHLGCRYCAMRSGFTVDQDAPAQVYLITNPELGSHKIGLARIGTTRIQQHQRQGWIVYKTLNVPTAAHALDIEVRILAWLRNERGLAACLTVEQMPQMGFTETFSADEIDLPTVWRKILQTSRILQSKSD